MAEQSGSITAQKNTAGAVLRPGRAADPLPEGAGDTREEGPVSSGRTEPEPPAVNDAETAAAGTAAEKEEPGAEDGGDGALGGQDQGALQAAAAARQRRLRLLLRRCDRVLLMDFDILAMNDWPDNFTLAAARRRRDLWLLAALVCATLFLSGLTGYVPAWLAGGGFGSFVIILLLGLPGIRRIYTSRPSYLDLLLRRRSLLADARRHAEHLEGREGLAWQCVQMAEYNPALRHPRFSELVELSERRLLPRFLTRREHVRLYLIFLLEAEKAYTRVQEAFLEGNQQAIDRGWKEVVAEPETRT